jgi:hypothetical protein
MGRLYASALAPLCFALVVACGGSEDEPIDLGPDAHAGSGAEDAGAAAIDADIPPDVNHFRLVVDPEIPRAGVPFTLEVQAFASEDDSEPLTDYAGPVSVTASAGALSGEVDAQALVDGAATLALTLSFGSLPDEVTLTIRDDRYPSITGTTEPFAVLPEGDLGELRDVVINEVKWFARGSVATNDFWIELRNTTESEMRLAGWGIDNAGTTGGTIDLPSGVTIPARGYLLVANRLGDDAGGERTSLTGVDNVFVPARAVSLRVGGEELVLRDREGTIVDQTPVPPGEDQDGGWPAGHNGADFLMSMERRDDLTGGGYGDGSLASEWYTWNEADGRNTTHPDTRDRGTPGADNTDPALAAPVALPYETSFEPEQPIFRLSTSAGEQRNDPPPGIAARTGERVLSADRALSGFSNRSLQSADCLALRNAEDALRVSAFARASEENSDDESQADLRLRFVIEWFTDPQCLVAHELTPRNQGANGGFNVSLDETAYQPVELIATPPSGEEVEPATHVRLRVEVRRETQGVAEHWALDDLTADQLPTDED